MSAISSTKGAYLAKLGEVKHVDLQCFILSAYKEDKYDPDFVQKYLRAYSVLLCPEFLDVLRASIKGFKDDSLLSKLNTLVSDLRNNGVVGSEADLAFIMDGIQYPAEVVSALSVAEEGAVSDESFDGETDETAEDVVRDYVLLVTKAYNKLYANVYSPLPTQGAYALHIENRPDGGIRHNGENGAPSVRTPSGSIDRLRKLYEMLGLYKLQEETYATAAKLSEPASAYYFTHQAGRFASGVIKTTKPRYKTKDDFEQALVKWVTWKLCEVYELYKDSDTVTLQDALATASHNLANAVVVDVFDTKVANQLVLRVCAPSIQFEPDFDELNAAYRGVFRASEVRNIVKMPGEDSDLPVYKIIVATNSLLERMAPMYAYQVWDELQRTGDLRQIIGTHKVIFGRNSDGSLHDYNMAAPEGKHHNKTVVADSRSGKGLTTLAALAAAAAHKEPIFYLDFKPDIAAIFWDYMREKGQDGRLFAFDGKYPDAGPIAKGSDIGRYRHFQPPEELPSMDGEILDGFVICKILTLMMAIMSCVNSNVLNKGVSDKIGYDPKKGPGVFVFDEMEKLDLEKWKKFFVPFVTNLKEDKKGDPKTNAYIKRLKEYYESVQSTMAGSATALNKQSYIGKFMLYQSLGYATGGASSFRGLFGTSSFVGKIMQDGATSEILKAEAANKTLTAGREHFLWYSCGSPKGIVSEIPSMTEPIKPFLLFNDMDAVEGYLENAEVFKTLPSDFKSKLDKKKMHIFGMLEEYGIDIGDSLAMGYDIAQNILRLVGFEGTVHDYCFSTQLNTLISCSGLITRVRDEVKRGVVVPAAGSQEAANYLESLASGVRENFPSLAGDMSDGFDDGTGEPEDTTSMVGDMSDGFDDGTVEPDVMAPLESDTRQASPQGTDVQENVDLDIPPFPDFSFPEPSESSVWGDETGSSESVSPEADVSDTTIQNEDASNVEQDTKKIDTSEATNILSQAESFAKESDRQKSWGSNIVSQCDKESAWAIRDAISELRKRYQACTDALEGIRSLNGGNATGYGTVDTQVTAYLKTAEKNADAVKVMVEGLQKEMGYEQDSDTVSSGGVLSDDIVSESQGFPTEPVSSQGDNQTTPPQGFPPTSPPPPPPSQGFPQTSPPPPPPSQGFPPTPQPQTPPKPASKGFFTAPDGRRYFDSGNGNLVPILTTPDGKAFFSDDKGNLIPAEGRFAVSPGSIPGTFNGQKMTSAAVTDSGSPRFGFNADGSFVMSDPDAMPYAEPIGDRPVVRMKRKQKDFEYTMSNKQIERGFTKRWEALLRAGSSIVGGRDLVTLLFVGEREYSVNDMPVEATEDIVGTVRVSDLVDIRSALKYYKNLKWLSLDTMASIGFFSSFSSPVHAFTLSKTLQCIRFMDGSGKESFCTRAEAANYLNVHPMNLSSRMNCWSSMAAQVNKGSTSSFCKPGSRLIMADWTKRLAAGIAGPGSTWSRGRRAGGALLIALTGMGTVVTGGIQAARAAVKPKY